MYIDTHAHLTCKEILPSIEEVLLRAKENKIDKIVNICTNSQTLTDGVALAKKYPWIFNAAATTPHDVEKEGESFFPLVEREARSHNLVAIGETGLDYYYLHSDREIQKQFLQRYFELALKVKLPLIFHCRQAFKDLFSLANEGYKNAPAVLHCFTGSIADAREALERGWYLSFSGILTFKKSQELQEVAKYVPLDRIFLETDSPYLAPQSKRGQRNEPAFLPETAFMLAQIKGLSLEDVANVTSENACKFFSFSKQQSIV